MMVKYFAAWKPPEGLPKTTSGAGAGSMVTMEKGGEGAGAGAIMVYPFYVGAGPPA